ncbi:MAG TPA: GPW/gp25 family protein [Oceanobacillus sp.]|jgi:phage baseplate assembly protein W|nr:GPW/gp25 family protein [Oceanobacillus sp.]
MINNIVGRGWAFPPHLDDRDRFALSQDDADIRQAIYIILMTAPGERVMRPEFGCRIHELIFDPANDQTAATAERYVQEALARWEPRIRVERVTATPGGGTYGQLDIEIEYEIKSRHDKRSLVFPFYLIPSERG